MNPYGIAIATGKKGYITNAYVLPGLPQMPHYKITKETIIRVVCESLNVDADTLKTRTREAEYVKARRIIWTLVMQFCPLSLKKAGLLFNRDHASVLCGLKMLDAEIKLYP